MNEAISNYLFKHCSTALLSEVLGSGIIVNAGPDSIEIRFHPRESEEGLYKNVLKVVFVILKAGGHVTINGAEVHEVHFARFDPERTEAISNYWIHSRENNGKPFYDTTPINENEVIEEFGIGRQMIDIYYITKLVDNEHVAIVDEFFPTEELARGRAVYLNSPE
jgi:hypothetical protein